MICKVYSQPQKSHKIFTLWKKAKLTIRMHRSSHNKKIKDFQKLKCSFNFINNP